MRTRLHQQGMALMVMLAMAVLGIAWITVAAIGQAASTPAEREERTAAALQAAKEALLAYVALRAGDAAEEHPGRLPCPEHPAWRGTANEGEAGPQPGFTSCTQVGRLPWKTLGIDQLRDGDGEPLWYAVATGTWALQNTTSVLSINPGLANQLAYDASPLPAPNAVAVIIAPGRALNTLAAGTPPAGCSASNQQASRYALPLVAARFLECGNQSGNYRKAGAAPWSNDRSISIGAAEVMDAIIGGVADRLQRQLAPAMNDWYNFQSIASWGQRFLPNASLFNSAINNPAVNNLCGNLSLDVREGMPPTATVASGTCNTNWSGGKAGGLGLLLNFGGCTPGASEMRCNFSVLLGGLISPSISVTAPNIANSFRSFNPNDIRVEVNGSAQGANVVNYNPNLAGNGSANMSVEIQLPLLSLFDNVVVVIPNPVDAALTDVRSRWWVVNGWDRYTYYAVPRAVTVDPGGDDCRSGDTSECIVVNGMPNPTNRKRFVLALMGQRPIAGSTWPGASTAAYLEDENASTLDRLFETKSVGPAFNDRLAACPHTVVTASGNRVVCAW